MILKLIYYDIHNTFAVKMFPGGEHLLSTKEILGPDATKYYSFPAAEPEATYNINKIIKYDSKLEFSDAARNKFAALKTGEISIKDIPPLKGTVLYQHQIDGVNKVLNNSKVAILYQQGLGKTLIALMGALGKRTSSRPIIVVCPKITVTTWENEISLFFPKVTIRAYLPFTVRKVHKAKYIEDFKVGKSDIVITTFETFLETTKVKGEWDVLLTGHPQTVIIDEVSRLKGHTSNRGNNILKFVQSIENRIIMSGTLSVGSPLDVFMPLSFLSANVFGSFWQFRHKYCTMDRNNKFIVGYKNLEYLKQVVDRYAIQRSREQCIDLPDRIFTPFYYTLAGDQLKKYNEVINNDELTVPSNIVTNSAITKISKLRQITSGFMYYYDKVEGTNYEANPFAPLERVTHKFTTNPKREALAFLLQDITEKIIIWYYYSPEREAILAEVDKAGLSYSEDLTKYKELDKQVFVCHISRGIGFTLNQVTTMIYYSQSLKLDEREQSLDRNYRIGQKNEVRVIDLIGKDGIEEQIMELLSRKLDILNFINKSPECMLCNEYDGCTATPYKVGCVLHSLSQINKTTIKIDEV